MVRTTFHTITILLALTNSSLLFGNDSYTIYVANKNTPAYEFAKNVSDANLLGVERRIHKAFNIASKKLTTCNACTVDIKIAAGEYAGRAGVGHWVFPPTTAPDSTLRIIGGYNESFGARAPFSTPTFLKVSKNRSAPILKFEGRKNSFAKLVISGLAIDVGEGNSYDSETNSLLKGGSSSWPTLALGYLTVDKLIISDSIFMNASNGIAAPTINAMSEHSEVFIFNNFFMNNLHTWVVVPGGFKTPLKRYVVASNSFVMNWPFSADATTSNPGALEIGNAYSAETVEITGNLFAYNSGGAIHAQYDDDRGPHLVIRDNLFWGNGTLWGEQPADNAAVVGKFAGSGSYILLTLEDVEDDFDWDVDNNQSFDPELFLTPPSLVAAAYPDTRGTSETAESSAVNIDSISDTLDMLLADDDEFSASLDASDSADVIDNLLTDENSADFEDSFSIDVGDDETVNVSGYAPYFPLDIERLPSPYSAPNIGATSSRVVQY